MSEPLTPGAPPAGPGHGLPVVVLGAGVAGLSVALGLAAAGRRCTVVCDGTVGASGSSPLAQGGVAAAVGPDDSPSAHAADTIAVAAGLADPHVVEQITAGGPAAIELLIELGVAFDRGSDAGPDRSVDRGRGRAMAALALGREAGHRHRRIVHARGDATGAAIMAVLAAAVRGHARDGLVELVEHARAVDLVRAGPDGRQVVGVVVIGADGRVRTLLGSDVVLATGGYAHCFARTTTPPDVIGSGITLAARAGAVVADMELVQFHPTALDVAGADRLPLLTEALRGEGAVLVDGSGRRFMPDVHPDAELAPRDVVARAIYTELQAGRRPALDARGAVGDAFPHRFPTVFALAMAHGFDPRTDVLPVTPAAHYCMGGVAVDAHGHTSLEGLWAVGEVASSGLHGGNRLASNSLLEGLVMGRRVAARITNSPAAVSPAAGEPGGLVVPADLDETLAVLAAVARHGAVAGPPPGDEADSDTVSRLRRILWEGAGVVRHGDSLLRALADLDALVPAPGDLAARSAHTVGRLILTAALDRTESRGAHFRLDHPHLDRAQATRRVVAPAPVPVRAWALSGKPVERWAQAGAAAVRVPGVLPVSGELPVLIS